MTLFFIISVGFLIGVLGASLWADRLNSSWKILFVLGGYLACISLCALLFDRLLIGDVDFVNPWAFILLVVPCGVLIAPFASAFHFTRSLPFPLTHIGFAQSSFRVLLTKWLPRMFYVLTLCLLIIALARPVQVDRTVLPPTEGIDIILLMDVSASMQKDDFYPSRFVASQQTAKRFITKRPSDRIGVVVFAESAMLQAPLTLDHDSLQEYISGMYIGMINSNYTAIGDALGVAANHLKDSKAKSKVIILLTDGNSNAGSITPILAAKTAASLGMRIYTIATARVPDQDNPYSSEEDEINEGLLLEIAQRTGGKFYRANNETELRTIYDKINELEKTEFSPSSIVQRTDVYEPFLWAAFVLLLVGLIFEKVFLIKVP